MEGLSSSYAIRNVMGRQYLEHLWVFLSGDVRDEKIQQPPPNTLLYLLLRHSMLLEYAAAGSRLLIKRGLLPPALRREPELVDLPTGQMTQTVWRQLATNISVTGVAGP